MSKKLRQLIEETNPLTLKQALEYIDALNTSDENVRPRLRSSREIGNSPEESAGTSQSLEQPNRYDESITSSESATQCLA